MVRAAYLNLPRRELHERAVRAVARLADCRVCPRDCGVNRLEDRWAACKTGRYAIVSSCFPHFGEENCLRGWNGSGTIFFSHCNLRCVFCLPPETRVTTDNGLVPIEKIFAAGRETDRPEVRRLDGSVRVATREGRWTPVAKAYRHRYSGELIRLKPYCCPPITLTPNHRLLVASKDGPTTVMRVEARALTKDHRLIIAAPEPLSEQITLEVAEILGEYEIERKLEPRRFPAEELVVLFGQRKLRGRWHRGDFGPREDATIAANELVIENGRVRFQTERRPGIPLRLPLDERLAWLLGLYCAEGCVTSDPNRPNSHHVVFSLGHGELDLVAKVRSLLHELFGVDPRVVRRRTTYSVEVGKASLGLLFRRLCGPRSREKRVPSQLVRTGPGVLRSFLDGVAAGDGWEGETHLVINTVSLELALGLYEVGLLLGMLPTYHEWKPPRTKKIEGRRVRQSNLHYVKFPRRNPETGRRRSRWRKTALGYLLPIHRLERVAYEGPVYNLEVHDPDHSYLAPFVAVANCQNWDISQGIKPGRSGTGATAREIAGMMLELQRLGCHNINFVTPEHVVPQVLEAVAVAVEGGLALPIVYNTSAYDALESLALMDGIVDIYMPDFKFWSAEVSRKYLKAEDYPGAARAAIQEMHRQVGDLVIDADGLARRGVLLRHLVMPGELDETRAILEWVARELGPGTYVNLMDQYSPAGAVNGRRYPELYRRLSADEFRQAREIAGDLGLRRLDERRSRPRLISRLRAVF